LQGSILGRVLREIVLSGDRLDRLQSAALVRSLRCTAHGVSGCTPPCHPPARIRGRLRIHFPFLKGKRDCDFSHVSFRACRNTVLLECGFPLTKTTPGAPKCCFTSTPRGPALVSDVPGGNFFHEKLCWCARVRHGGARWRLKSPKGGLRTAQVPKWSLKAHFQEARGTHFGENSR